MITKNQKLHNELCDIFEKRLKAKKGEYDLFDLAFDYYKKYLKEKRKYERLFIFCDDEEKL
jgi:hypothetical protein